MTKKVVFQYLFLCLTMLLLGGLFGYQLDNLDLTNAKAADEQPSSLQENGPQAPEAVHVCVPENVAAFENRVHIKCATVSPDGFRYFALSTANSKYANRVFSLLLTAKAAGKRVGIDYNPSDTSGVSIGCQASDCRLIDWVYIVD